MPDPINTTASVVGILHRIVEAISWLFRRFQRKQSPFFPTHVQRYDFEVRPVSLFINLLHTVPYVELQYYAINYLTRRLILTSAEITELNCGLYIDRIPVFQEYTLDPKSTSLVIFRRNLLDSEARAVSQILTQIRLSASYSLIAKAKYRRREYTYGPVASMAIDGWVNKISQPDAKK